MYDLGNRVWADDWATTLAEDIELPRLAWPAEVAGTIHAAAAEETGLVVGTPVITGTVDAWSEAVSVGVRRKGDMMLMYGSTMFMVEVVDGSVRQPELWTTAGVFPGTTTAAAGLATSGIVVEWLRGMIGEPDLAALGERALDIGPGSQGLLVLPYFSGERTPINDPRARGLIIGLTLRHTSAHIYRAILEGTAFAVRHNLDYFRRAGAGPSRLVAVGGGASSDLWLQIVSDVIGLRQEVPATNVGASYGDAFLAALGVGLVVSDTVWPEILREVVPDPDTHGLYSELYGAYLGLYPATRDVMHQLAGGAGGVA